jgi:hypothetical protein
LDHEKLQAQLELMLVVILEKGDIPNWDILATSTKMIWTTMATAMIMKGMSGIGKGWNLPADMFGDAISTSGCLGWDRCGDSTSRSWLRDAGGANARGQMLEDERSVDARHGE